MTAAHVAGSAASRSDVFTGAVRVRAVALTVALSALDGYDVLSITFAAPAISKVWGIGKLALGGVLSSGLIGMALGSFMLAPVADLIGRRAAVLVSFLFMGVGSLFSANVGSVAQLAAWRVCTGLGIGGCVAVIAPLAAEFATARWRSFAVAAMAMGYPAGGLIGGLLAAALLRWSGWPAIFVAGAVAAFTMAVATAVLMPESPAFTAARRPPAYPSLRPDDPAPGRTRRGYAGVFAPDRIGSTARLALINALTAAAIYYLLSWLPQLVADAGLTPAQGSVVSATLSLLGIIGGVTLGIAASRYGPERITAAAIAALGVALACFAAVPATMAALTAAAGVLGFLVFASSAGFYAVLARGFDDAARASGSGFVIGVGRIASAVAPLLAGWLFAGGLGRGAVSAAFGGCALFAALVLALHRSPEAKA